MVDKFEDLQLNKEQERLKENLDFSENGLYIPVKEDIIYTLDVIYKEGIAHVGCDIVAFPNRHIKTVQYKTKSTGEYIPGYFSFYEGPVLIDSILEISKTELMPNLIIVDGHGLAHPREFGLACYVGVKLNLPAIGIAKKSLLYFDKKTLEKGKYSYSNFILNNRNIGVAIRLQENTNPVFISAGNRITLEMSLEIIKNMTSDFKYPDNIRRADTASRVL